MAAFQPASANPSSANPSSGPVKTSSVVSQQIVTFLFAEIVDFASRQDATMTTTPVDGTSHTASSTAAAPPSGNSLSSTNNNKDQENNGEVVVEQQSNEKLTVAAEMAAAKLERMGASVGYRLTERLCFSKTWTSTNAGSSSSGGSGGDLAAAVAAQQLEAVKFLCKDIWPELFNKQIDKLQTNHRGVFVLKDLNFLWLSEAFGNSETARCHAMLLLAFPCGLIRGVLSNLGIPAAVSCDFLSDGVNMASCAFNIKVK